MINVYLVKVNEKSKQSLYSKYLVRYGLFDAYRVKVMNFCHDEYGKPYIKDCDYHFNISHSGDFIVVMVDTNPCGVDIEKKKERDFVKLGKKHFSSVEYEYLCNGNLQESFYELWTGKEAYVKLIGKGLRMDLGSFCVKDNKIMEDSVILAYLKQYDIETDYKLTLCSYHEIESRVIFLTEEKLLEFIRG